MLTYAGGRLLDQRISLPQCAVDLTCLDEDDGLGVSADCDCDGGAGEKEEHARVLLAAGILCYRMPYALCLTPYALRLMPYRRGGGGAGY